LPGQAATAVMLRNSVVSYNVTGISVDALGAAAILCVAHSVVTGNTIGVTVGSGSTLFSYGDYDIDGNVTDNTGVLTVIPTH
jgi:hypothetical protein